MKFCSLASGSSGNCFYLESGNHSVLIDLGISCKSLSNKLLELGTSPEKLDAIFLTHEHTDHISGVNTFSSKFQVPIFATKGTSKHIQSNIEIISPEDKMGIGNLKIESFKKSHDSSSPVSYAVSSNGKKVSVITDLGTSSELVEQHIKESNALALESNHDLFMLQNSRYPQFLKSRILSDQGHLSNYDSALLVLEHSSSKLSNVLLSHLSKNTNTPLLALDAFQLLKERKDLKTRVSIAPRFSMSQMIEI